MSFRLNPLPAAPLPPFNPLEILRHKAKGVIKRWVGPSVELRRAKRQSVKVPLFYRLPGLGIKWEEGKSLNISSAGVCLWLNHPVNVGDPIEIEVILPDTKEILKISAHVALVQPTAVPGRCKCGIDFKESQIKFRRVSVLLSNIADKNCHLLKYITKPYIGHSVQNLGQLKAAYRVVYKEYAARHLCQPHTSGLHYNFYSILPGTNTFLLKKKEKIYGTVSLIEDSPAGLPMESMFPEEIQNLRAQGRRLAEVGALALNSELIDKQHYSLKNFQKQACLFKLFKTMFDYARYVGVTDLVIGVIPKHAPLYKYLNFENIGSARPCSIACGKMGVLMRMDIPNTVRNNVLLNVGPGVYFLKNPTPPSLLKKQFILSTDDMEDFLYNIKPLWKDLSEKQKKHLHMEKQFQMSG